MDPNETLAALRRWKDHLFVGEHSEDHAKELFEALDEWLSKGGFLPRDWRME